MNPTLLQSIYDIFQSHPHVTTDTRALSEGALFFALKGANFDGNKFAATALEAGCVAAIVDDPEVVKGDERMILVPNVLETLQALAALHRRTLGIPVLQITGTNGKTTTKELCAAVLSQKYRTLYTQGNLNNHIGVPLTLLRLTHEHQMAVVETGANHPGEIRLLTDIVQPDAGLITNVGLAHLEGFGSFEGVVSTKCELYDYLRQHNGTVFLHADNDVLVQRANGLHTITYGSHERQAYVQGEVIANNATIDIRWRTAAETPHDTPLQLIGTYNLPNALAAIAVGLHYGVAPDDISRALEAYTPTNNRSELRRTPTNTLIVDAYTANPTSMAAALNNFDTIAHAHKRVILGEMLELGHAATEAHRSVIDQLLRMNLEEIWLVGSTFALLSEAECHAHHVRLFQHVDEVRTALHERPIRDSLILIKGSNGTRLFTLPDLL